MSRGLFTLNIVSNVHTQTVDNGLVSNMEIWLQRLGHVHVEGIEAMVKDGAVIGINVDSKDDLFHCTGCIYGKSTSTRIPRKVNDRSPAVLDIAPTEVRARLPGKCIGSPQ